MGILEAVTIVFLVLKLVGVSVVATWGWIWIFSPLWIGYGVVLVVCLLSLLVIVALK